MKNSVFLASGLVFFTAIASLAQLPVPLNQLPSRIVGHPAEGVQPLTLAPNLVEGREMWNPVGIALDTSVSPPAVYVSDYNNNRVMGWKNATSFRNGDKADLIIGQSGSPFTTGIQGPGTNFSSGLNSPAGLLVDPNGNLYVVDQLNNRILRFPKPFAQQGGQFPDLYIGQLNTSSRSANFTGAVADQGLSLANSPWPTGIAFDPQNNLWVVDGGNRRVLRFAAADVAAGGGPLRANLVLGQLDFTSVQPAVGASSRTTPNVFSSPQGIAFDPAGRLYVSDGLPDRSVGRVLVFTPPFTNNQSAARMMGVIPGTTNSQDVVDKTIMTGPSSVFFIPSASKMGVADTLSHRILLFDSFDKWPDVATSFSPLATGVIGQPNFNNRFLNGAVGTTFAGPASSSSFSGPFAATFSGSELFVADTGNNRVLVLPFAAGAFGPATRVLGQDNFTSGGINLVEGREFAFLNQTSNGISLDAGVALDETGDTPHLFVADTYNHRVLGFTDFRKIQAGSKADIVLGQPDFSSNLCNVTGNPDAANASTLCFPTGLAVDAQGNLYVADLGNGRVLRFPAPFARQGQLSQADLVLGQRNFTTKVTDPSPSTMSQPYGLALAGPNGLFVSDLRYNRVLYFPFPANGTFSAGTDNGRSATKVFGQPDFTSVGSGNADTALSAPHHIAADNEARLYVTDTGNNRVVIFDQVNVTPTAGAHATFTLGPISQPRGIFVNQLTSEIWVAEGGTNAAKRYPRYSNLILNSAATNTVLAGTNALAVAQDQFGDLVVADGSSRVGMYYPNLQAYNGGHFLPTRAFLAPGLLASICSPGSACDPASRSNLFGANTAAIGDLPNPFPMPRTLGDVQVLFGTAGGDLTPVPLYYVSPSQINFVVPMNAPTSGNVDIQVVQPSTGRIFAAGQMPMNTAAPGILQMTYTGKNRQAALINADGTPNSPTNPALRGTYVSLYATGQGFVPGAPPDGVPVTGAVPTLQAPRIALNNIFLDDYVKNPEDKPKDQWLPFSGLQQFPGLWQINFYIPSGVNPTSPGNSVSILILAGASILSTDGTINMTIAVK